MLEMKNLHFQVEEAGQQKEILKDINLVIDDKKFVAITGPNGGGKSTLAKVIMGIEQPSSGQILLDGEDITHLDVTQRAKRGIGFAFQQPVRFKGLSVKDMLSISAGERLETEQACRYLSEVGLCAIDYVNRELNQSLSGGELKRIEIAMVIARGTRISLFDEPEAGIDLWSFGSLIRVFENLRASVGGSILVISHQERLLSIADEIVIVAEGKIQDQGPKDKLLPGLLGGLDTCRFYKGA